MKIKIYIHFLLVLVSGMLFPFDSFAGLFTVQVGNDYFSPSNVNAMVDDTIRWVWVAGNHTTTSIAVPSGASSWDSPINSTHTSYMYVISVSGNYNYQSTYMHP